MELVYDFFSSSVLYGKNDSKSVWNVVPYVWYVWYVCYVCYVWYVCSTKTDGKITACAETNHTTSVTFNKNLP